MGILREADRGRLDNGGTLDDAALFLFERDSYDDCPLPISFNDLPTVDFILGSFGCEGSMTDFGYFVNEMMKDDDDIRCVCVCVWILKKKIV